MRSTLVLNSPDYGDVTLRAIAAVDLENLRQWKNANRQYFFYQQVITPAEQARWFDGYLAREHDQMFIVSARGTDIGCMAFRQLEAGGDVYNVILGRPDYGRQGFMTHAFHLLCSYALAKYPTRLGAKVLRDNPALAWYYRNGFRPLAEFPDHVEIELDQTRYVRCPVVEA